MASADWDGLPLFLAFIAMDANVVAGLCWSALLTHETRWMLEAWGEHLESIAGKEPELKVAALAERTVWEGPAGDPGGGH